VKKFSSKTIVFAGVLIAMHIIFARFISIPVGQILRISISGVPLVLSGLWLGPVTGGICGLIGDLIGCAINGYAPNPFITIATVLVGLIPGLFCKFMVGDKPGVKRFLRFLLVIAITRFLSSQLLTTFGLSVMYGMPFTATFISRFASTTVVTLVDAFLSELIYSRVRISEFYP
jgi:ECF transporter S component (folate family)